MATKKKVSSVSVSKRGKKTVSSKKIASHKIVKKTQKKSVKKLVKKKISKRILSITEQVEKVLDRLRPYLVADGGNIELMGVDETHGIVTVHLVGACANCSSAQVTLYSGVERALKEKIPQINALIAL